jgi:hypothetical protein
LADSEANLSIKGREAEAASRRFYQEYPNSLSQIMSYIFVFIYILQGGMTQISGVCNTRLVAIRTIEESQSSKHIKVLDRVCKSRRFFIHKIRFSSCSRPFPMSMKQQRAEEFIALALIEADMNKCLVILRYEG